MYDFIEKIKIKPGCKMISFDVRNLYTTIFKVDVFKMLTNNLTISNK